jgi:hypothetical protein
VSLGRLVEPLGDLRDVRFHQTHGATVSAQGSGIQCEREGLSFEPPLSGFERILVAVADDAASSAAVGAAADLAARSGAEVLAVHAWYRDVPCCGPSAAECGLREDDGASNERSAGFGQPAFAAAASAGALWTVASSNPCSRRRWSTTRAWSSWGAGRGPGCRR